MDKKTIKHLQQLLRQGTITWHIKNQALNRDRELRVVGTKLNGQPKYKYFYKCQGCSTFTPHKELLEELKICSSFQKDTSNYLEPACSPRFFKVFPMNEKVNVKNAFLVQIKSKVGGIKLRRFLAFVRERGELVKCNAFVANLIAKIKTKSGYDDLVLRFNDNVEGDVIFYNCLFSWDGFKYNFKILIRSSGIS